jgi:ribosomal-protein-alanine N-acetyltransferase
MEFAIRPMMAADAQQIARWHYDGEYAFYDMANDPEDLAELMDPRSWENAYYAVADGEGDLVGFFCFSSEGNTVEIGLGLRPDLTGKGLGQDFLKAGLRFAAEHLSARSFRLSVATFNQRAIRLYTRAGFRPSRVYTNRTNGGEFEFLEMTLEA